MCFAILAVRTVIHARSDIMAYYASLVARRLPSVRYVYDHQGDGAAEIEHYADEVGTDPKRRQRKIATLRRQQLGALSGASDVFCVSKVLQDRLINRYGLPRASTECLVWPMLGSSTWTKSNGKTPGAHSGSRSISWSYSRVASGIGTMHQIQGLMQERPDVFFLVLTPDVPEATSFARAMLPEGRYSIRTVSHVEVLRHLRAADLSLLLRQPHPLNEVACPTKISQSTCSAGYPS